MKTTESEKVLERSLKKLVENTMNGLCIKLLSQHLIGLPDRLCLLPGGRAFFVELKSTGKKPRKIQIIVHNRLRSLGFRVYVIDSSESLNALSKEWTINTFLDNSEFDYGHNVPCHDPSQRN